MQPTKYIQIGQLLKPVGTGGEIKVEIDDDFWDELADLGHFFIKINGAFVPYFIEDFRESNHLLMKIENIDSPEDSSKLSLKTMFLRQKDLKLDYSTKDVSKVTWIGYDVFHGKERVGTIEDIQIFPQQIMAILHVGDKTNMLPLVDEWIVHVSEESKQIIMDLPHGILDI